MLVILMIIAFNIAAARGFTAPSTNPNRPFCSGTIHGRCPGVRNPRPRRRPCRFPSNCSPS